MNTSESDPHSYEATKAVAKKSEASTGFESMTSVMPVRCLPTELLYEALLGEGPRGSSRNYLYLLYYISGLMFATALVAS